MTAGVTGPEHNKQLVRRIVEEMFNLGRLEVAHEIFGPDFVDRGHESMADKRGGPEGFAHFVKVVREVFPDISATIQTIVAEGDYVAMWNTATATHRGELFGMAPSGKRISMKDFHFFRFKNGRVVEHWNQVALT
jgi:predicted ester cyclase